MPKQIIGYYSVHMEQLLKEFDRLSELLTDTLVARYGEGFTVKLQKEACLEYQKLIPEIPYIKGLRAKVLNRFLIATAQELAVYKAMKPYGKSPGEVWEICHQGIHFKMAQIPRWKRWLLRRFMFSALVRFMVSRRAQRQQKVRFGDFEVAYVIGDGQAFDYGINYLHCGNLDFARKHGGAEFAPFICMSDIAMSEALGWGLIRTQTLADGCAYCDFRFKKAAITRISSKTPEVQATIDRIRHQETGPQDVETD